MGNSIWVVILRLPPLLKFIQDSRILFGGWVTEKGPWVTSLLKCRVVKPVALWMISSRAILPTPLGTGSFLEASIWPFSEIPQPLPGAGWRWNVGPHRLQDLPKPWHLVVVVLKHICKFLNIPPIKRGDPNPSPPLWIWTSFGVTGWIVSVSPPLPHKSHTSKPQSSRTSERDYLEIVPLRRKIS